MPCRRSTYTAPFSSEIVKQVLFQTDFISSSQCSWLFQSIDLLIVKEHSRILSMGSNENIQGFSTESFIKLSAEEV